MFRNIVSGEAAPSENTGRYNALNHLLNSKELGGAAAAAVRSGTVVITGYNRSDVVIAAGTPVAVESGMLEKWENDVWHISGCPIVPAADDSVFWGIAAGNISPGEWGGVTVHGLVQARLSGVLLGNCVVPQNGRLVTAAVGKGRLLKTDAPAGWGMIYLGDGGMVGYDGYFKIINENGVIKVVDGASYNPETGTSNGSWVQVNNRRYEVPAQAVTLIEEYARSYICLKFTAPVYNDAGRVETPAKVEVTAEAVQPSNTSQSAYYQIGRVFNEDSEIRIVQDHTSGVPQMWWFAICQ